MSRLRVMALSRYGALGASSRLRMVQYQPALQRAGVEAIVFPLLRDEYLNRLYAGQRVNWLQVVSDYVRRLVTLLDAGSFDLLWIEKELFPMLPASIEIMLQRVGIQYVVDYDDATFHNYDQRRWLVRALLGPKIDRIMRGATVVVCGNRYLAEWATAAGTRRVEWLPTVVDLDRYPLSRTGTEHCRRSPFIVGWIGSPSTVRYLANVAPMLARMSMRLDLQLRVVGASFSWPGLRVQCRPWQEETEASEIRAFDVGIMPLADSPWARGKCGYKLIQYMACGVPVVASAVGANIDIVEHGRQGFVAHTDEDWESALLTLAGNPGLAVECGFAGRARVEQKYCLAAAAPRLVALLREAAGKGSL